jgi:hypothetical protein
MAKPTTKPRTQTRTKPHKTLIPEKALDDVLARLLAVPKVEVDAAVAKPIRAKRKQKGKVIKKIGQ